MPALPTQRQRRRRDERQFAEVVGVPVLRAPLVGDSRETLISPLASGRRARTGDHDSTLMLHPLYVGEARQRTVAEYSELFRATGVEFSRVVSTASAFSIVEARPVSRSDGPH
jgi:hypothetical protein